MRCSQVDVRVLTSTREKISYVDERVLTTTGAKTSHIDVKGSEVDGRQFSKRRESDHVDGR